jgi:arylsulfatase A-like enzyme
VEFVDVYPTLAEVCGLPVPDGLGGDSLKQFLENPDAPATDVAISQYPKSAPDGPVMGYSIRDSRYRATFWRERNGAKIVATELYDEQDDPDETVSLADRPEHKDLLESLAKHLPPVGSDFNPAAKSKGKGKDKGKSPAKPVPPSADEPRDVRYDRLYPGKARLTVEEYLAKQSNEAEARERFARFDRDKDGFLSRDEFLTGGKQ